MYYTYGHYKADTKELFYIGKGKNNRAYEKDSRSDFWRNIVNKHNYTIEIFSNWETEEEAFIHEKFLIDCFGDLTKLCNLTNGGDGCSGYVWTDDQKQKLKLRKSSRLGAKLPDWLKEKIRIKQIGIKRKPHSKEHSAKIGLALKNKKKSVEHIEKLKLKAQLESKQIVTCPYCNKSSNGPVMKRWHFENCKEKHGKV